MDQFELEHRLDDFLSAKQIKDYCPNGLQVQGKSEVKKIITGVTACQALIDAAIERKADAILVHHGYFWRGESPAIRGMKYHRLQLLIKHDINLYAYHLPLDVHPTLGNNALLAKLLGINIKGGMESGDNAIPIWGEFAQALTPEQLCQKITAELGRTPLLIQAGEHPIKRIGWCTGAGQDYIDIAAELGLDAFLSGEISERTTFSAREQGVHYIAAGHHATERSGIQALGEWLASEHGMAVEFIDIDNPV